MTGETVVLCTLCDWSARGTYADEDALAQQAAAHAQQAHPDEQMAVDPLDPQSLDRLPLDPAGLDRLALLLDATRRLSMLEVLHHPVPDGSRCCCGERECFVAAVLQADPEMIEKMERDAQAILQARARLN